MPWSQEGAPEASPTKCQFRERTEAPAIEEPDARPCVRAREFTRVCTFCRLFTLSISEAVPQRSSCTPRALAAGFIIIGAVISRTLIRLRNPCFPSW